MTDVYHRTAFAGNGMMTWKGLYFQIPGWTHYRLTGTIGLNCDPQFLYHSGRFWIDQRACYHGEQCSTTKYWFV